MSVTTLLLGRRPSGIEEAFGFVALEKKAEAEIADIVQKVANHALGLNPIDYHADDHPDRGEVMVRDLAGIDAEFQKDAPWSIERLVKAIRATGVRDHIGGSGVDSEHWTFYSLEAACDQGSVVVIRNTSPTRALNPNSRMLSQVVGDELRLVQGPLVGIDRRADAVVIGEKVFIFEPQSLERLFVDGDTVKSLAPALAKKFEKQSKAKLDSSAIAWVEKACEGNVNVARRVQRLTRDGTLKKTSVKKLRAGLRDANLPTGAFGSKDQIELTTEEDARALIDIAADLYYQPRFDSARRVRQYRKLK